MFRETIDFGIDLGTTNSTIAVLNGTRAEVIENFEGNKCTASAVWIDQNGQLFVGSAAKERLESDKEDAFSEFKQMMGNDSHIYRFASSGREMKSEDLSAEVLKSLKADVHSRLGEDITASVITVPASFNLPENKATYRAAELAGLLDSPLLLEPAAAALAYGFQSDDDRVYWLVYDLGGGTFDAALINVRDNNIRIANHGGDKKLGGKLIDWDIVYSLLVPVLENEYKLPDFRHDNPKWRRAFARMKASAESAKIRLSRVDSYKIELEQLCKDKKGKWVELECELKRSQIEPLIEPYVERSLAICEDVLAQKRLGAGDVAKMLLVGGPTIDPLLREMISSRMGIELDYSVDPLTAVSQGAAIFAGTQRQEIRVVIAPDEFSIDLEYEPVGDDPEPIVGGLVSSPENADLSGFTVELIESQSGWSSGKTSLSAKGGFSTNLKAEEGRKNEYKIELRDATGTVCQTVPTTFSYTIGGVFRDIPLTHSVGIGLANNEMEFFLEKGTLLPAHDRRSLTTVVELKKGSTGSLIRIPVFEGEKAKRAFRNHEVGTLQIVGDHLERDVPVGSEIVVTINIDESHQVTTTAYVPIIDEEFVEVMHFQIGEVDPDRLAKDVAEEMSRLERIIAESEQMSDPLATEILKKIEREKTAQNVEAALNSAMGDPSAANLCQDRLLDLRNDLDAVEDAMEWPKLVEETKKELEDTRQMVVEHGEEEDRRNLKQLEVETNNAIVERDQEGLKSRQQDLTRLYMKVFRNQDFYWPSLFMFFEKPEQMAMMSDRGRAKTIAAQGRRAFDNNDLGGVNNAAQQLQELFQGSVPDITDDRISDVMLR